MSDLQAQTDLYFVRRELAPPEPPPERTSGPVTWLRKNLFATPTDAVMTILALLFVAYALPGILEWALFKAVWDGADRTACLGDVGACWAFVKAKFPQFIYGRYPLEERWRVDIVFFLLAAGLIPMAIPAAPWKRFNLIFLMLVLPVVSFLLLTGGAFGLEEVETALWGGLLVTLVVSYIGIVVSLPLGILLALGRRSDLPAVRFFSIGFIELWRGVPLITVLFMASVMLPLFLPAGMNFNKLLRALIGVALFSSAYVAEVIRGGLQAIPKGQYEAARALGLGYWQMMRLIVLPQALKLVIPGIVNSFISLLKDTSLVYIIGLFDLLGIVRLNFSDANWATPETPATGLVFAALVFWIFCFGMSRYSQGLERRLNTGHKR
ncbi:amino acid ABC transporter permease [Propylenella binzhouense]|uniref:Amino acid ABC transporter permease n=1 Tax=Propylenella binzhouense TaxID=2555902 RepID=A0A964T991_9HYPH|nr:amino acid ABC transporter permease [Propylenella binzhouense]MYZ50129.1 amino acid ABC transporter permease [Propylenella binzhouense]